MSRYLVNSCICHRRDFTEIKEHAKEKGYTQIEELQAEDFCSCSCGLCIPYVKMVLKTGETEFEPGAPYKNKAS